MRLARLPLLTAIAILALAMAAIMHRWLLLNGVPASFRGEIVPEINYIWLIRQQIEAGHPFALWLPKFLGGEAVATHAAYPLYWLLALVSWLLNISVERVYIGADYLVFLGGAVGTLALVRRLTGQLAAGVVAGAIFSLIPAHLNAIEGFYLQWAWMLIPWAFWLIEKRGAQPSLRVRDVAAPGMLLGVLLLLGIQMAMMMVPYIAIYLLFREWQLWHSPHLALVRLSSRRSRTPHSLATWWKTRGRFWFLSGLIGLGISLSFYLPTAFDLFDLGWSRYVNDELGVVVDLSFLWFMLHYRWSPEMTPLRWHHISWYLGDVAIGLALLGGLTHLRKRLNWLYVGVALISFLLLVGESLGTLPNLVYQGVAIIPLFNGVLRRSFRFVLPFSLALAVLAGFGVATLLRWLQKFVRLRTDLRTVWAGLALATLLSAAVLGDYWLHRGNFRMLPSYLEPERAALVDWLNQQPEDGGYWIPFEYGLTPDGYLRGYHIAAMHHPINRPGIWDDSFVGHYASRRAAELLQACIVTHPLWADSLTPILSSMFDLANVRYLILNRDVEQQYKLLTSLEASDLPLVFAQGALRVFENRDTRPFVQFYAAAVRYTGTNLPAQFQDWLPLTQARNLALLDDNGAQALSIETALATDDNQAVAALDPAPVLQVSSTWQRPAPNHLQIAATLPQTATLVVAEAWFPGWQVQVDGVRQPLLRANYAFMGVQLGAGSHTIDFIYSPPWYTWLGWAIASLTWAGALWLWVVRPLLLAHQTYSTRDSPLPRLGRVRVG